ncbi:MULTISPECIES: hypothetical protein [Streptomyces]|uniref:Uncharacterized protein n=1 Tax=Streptomyces solicathayae TaxID=3081768 RepID=A0ABZ0LL09_9ACTN|nr:hypothetical protein [Streptomyces sp. HUAS YS2]WOX20116.1 hypothetical protein R2D22_01390 [Streptomyces sp. HUAS YS2]
MDEDTWLERHGLHPEGPALDEVRALLSEQTGRERQSQGLGNTILMRLCCVQLFNGAALDDVLLIWRAKTASWDASISIDVQLLCGAGLAASKEYLAGLRTEEAEAALRRIVAAEQGGEFEDFTPAAWSAADYM